MSRKSMKWRVALAGAAVAAVAAGGSAVALATGSSNAKVYGGCVSAGKLYNVRINPTSQIHCHHGGTAISWNQTGPAGAPGLTGPQGPQGPQGARGPAGAQGVQGQAGPPGSNGNTVLHGSGAPSSTLGSVGDFYLNTATSGLYGPKTSAGWGSPTSLIGARGPAGASPTLTPSVQSKSIDVPNSAQANWIFACPSGYIATGGGGGFTTASSGLVLEYSAPTVTAGTPTGWQIETINTSGSTATETAYVVCLPTTAQNAAAASTAEQPTATMHLSAVTP
jgi:hypothetical protein